jgi:hypothetical protein
MCLAVGADNPYRLSGGVVMTKFYAIIGSLLLVFYLSTSFFGWEFGDTKRKIASPEERKGGSFRSFYFGHFGYHGGK